MVLSLSFILQDYLQDYQPKPQAPSLKPQACSLGSYHLSLMIRQGRLLEELSLDSAGSAMQALQSALPVFP